MRKLAIILTIVVIIPLFSLQVFAKEDVDKHIEEFEEMLPDEFSGITEDTDMLMDRVGLEALLSEVVSAVTGNGSQVVSFLLLLLGGAVMLCLSSLGDGRFSGFASSAVSIAISFLLLTRLAWMFEGVESGIICASDFFAGLIPLFSAVTVAGGGAAGAAVTASVMNFTVTVICRLLLPLMISLVGASLAFCALAPAGGGDAARMLGGVRSVFLWLIGILTALIMGALALQTLIASAKDSASMRAARYAASGLIPVVGGTVSASLATLAAGLSYVRGVIGVGAAAVIVSVLLSPMALLLLNRLALSAAITVSDMICAERASALYSSFRKCFDLFIAMYAMTVLLYLFQIILFVITEAPIG